MQKVIFLLYMCVCFSMFNCKSLLLEVFLLKVWYLCVTQLFGIAFRAISPSKVIVHIHVHTYNKYMQSVCRADTVRWAKYSCTFGNAYFVLETRMPMKQYLQ